jgi:acetyl-CoA carboxylase carboxyl transferase subunit beta
VVKETTHADLPPGFQTAEFMMEHGLVDIIVARKDMRATLSKIVGYMSK